MKLITCHLQETRINQTDSIVVDPKNFNQCWDILKSAQNETVEIYDLTKSKKLNPGEIISVNDHINKTGQNPLIGKQKSLSIDFIDLSTIYNQSNSGVITECCGEYLFEHSDFPTHYLCNIIIIAAALKIPKVSAFIQNQCN